MVWFQLFNYKEPKPILRASEETKRLTGFCQDERLLFKYLFLYRIYIKLYSKFFIIFDALVFFYLVHHWDFYIQERVRR